MTEGVAITRKRLDMVPAGARLRMLRDHILVKPLPWEPSKTLEVAGSQRNVLRGTVVAVGPGVRRRRYHYNSKGERVRVSEINGIQIPCDLKVGDVVELGGLEIHGYTFPEVLIGTERHVIAQEADVAMVVE